MPATIFSGAVSDQNGRLGTLEGSWSSWHLFLLPGPLPMEAIEKMANLCMRDPDEEEGTDDEDVEADDDLLVSVQVEQRASPAIVSPSVRPSCSLLALCPCRRN